MAWGIQLIQAAKQILSEIPQHGPVPAVWMIWLNCNFEQMLSHNTLKYFVYTNISLHGETARISYFLQTPLRNSSPKALQLLWHHPKFSWCLSFPSELSLGRDSPGLAAGWELEWKRHLIPPSWLGTGT